MSGCRIRGSESKQRANGGLCNHTDKQNKTKKMASNNERQMKINEEIGWAGGGGFVRGVGARGERPEGGVESQVERRG